MKPGGQKAKGNAYERKIAELFTKAYYPDEDGEIRRVPMSGAWDKRSTPGDLIAFKYRLKGSDEMIIDTSFPLVVECKDWKDVKHFFTGLYGNESAIFDWMRQAELDAKPTGKIPFVSFKLYRQANIGILRATDFSRLKELFGEPEFKYYFLRRYPSRKVPDDLEDCIDYPDLLVFFLLDDFLEWIDWSHFKVQRYIRSWTKNE
jgi:hypothetical protein